MLWWSVGLLGGCAESGTDACREFVPDDHHMSVYALDAASGRVRWQHTELPLYANGYTHLSGPLVVVSRGVTGETFDLQSGTAGPPPPGTIPAGFPATFLTPGITVAVPPGVSVPTDAFPSAPWDAAVVSGDDGVVIDAAPGNGELVGFDPDTGQRRWTFALDRPAHSAIHMRDGVVVVSTGDDVPGCG